MINQLMNEAIRLFDQPSQWTDSPIEHVTLDGDWKNVFRVSGIISLEQIMDRLLIQGKKNVAVFGVNPNGLAVAFLMQQHGFRVTLMPAGNETDSVKHLFGQDALRDFFSVHHIEFWPYEATAIKGEQIHCQSGYCSYVCKGRFIQEGEDAERLLTETGTIFVEAIVLADECGILTPA